MGKFGSSRLQQPRGRSAAGNVPVTQLPLFTGAYIKGSDYNSGWSDSPFDLVGFGGGPNTTPTFETNAGKGCSILHWGQQWQRNGVSQAFFPNDHNAVRNHGSIPLLDWAPWDLTLYPDGKTMPPFAMDRIVAGDWDSYITSWATGCATWGHPIFVRLMWEMNGDFFSWGNGVNGTTPENYVAAFRHIVTLCRAAGATNITWVWCPNIIEEGAYPITGMYPGDDYVDWVGIDGYCAGSAGYNQTFVNTFTETYNAIYAVASTTKPMMLGEWGCHDVGVVSGSKAIWIADAFTQIRNGVFPRLRAVLWFNWNADGKNWRIENGAGAQSAYAAGISNSVFKANDYAALGGTTIAAPT